MKCISVKCLGLEINHKEAVKKKSLGETNSTPALWQRTHVSPQILALPITIFVYISFTIHLIKMEDYISKLRKSANLDFQSK